MTKREAVDIFPPLHLITDEQHGDPTLLSDARRGSFSTDASGWSMFGFLVPVIPYVCVTDTRVASCLRLHSSTAAVLSSDNRSVTFRIQ